MVRHLQTLTFLIPLILAGCSGSSSSTGSDACAGVACSSHGSCKSAGAGAYCVCDNGYSTSGLSCVATTGSCQGITCSGHGSCADSGGTPTCTCESGYAASGMACNATNGPCVGVTCSGHGTCTSVGTAASCTCDSGYVASAPTTCEPTVAPVIGGCQVLPSNHVFNTPIDSLPAHPNSSAFIATIGTHRIHLDLGVSTDITSSEYYGIPYNVVHGGAITWSPVNFGSTDPDMSWDPRSESDCSVLSDSSHKIVSPCTTAAAANPAMPIPPSPLVEGGIDRTASQPYGDHHMLLLDVDTCRLWELYHCYPNTSGGWDIFGAATFDLKSNMLRPADWTSADAAGFPILPLLLRADEATSGAIHHAMRFTIQSSKIRNQYVWPARHLTSNGTTSQNLPPMGQLFRLKASYTIPTAAGSQARAILQALKTYGMYIADGGSDLYIQGEPSAAWTDDTFSVVQSVTTDQFEAVDTAPIQQRPGFDVNSAAVP